LAVLKFVKIRDFLQFVKFEFSNYGMVFRSSGTHDRQTESSA